MILKEAKEKLESRIEAACKKVGRKQEEVRLIAVSKAFPAEKVEEAYATGLRLFGENKAQDFRDKVPVLPEDIEWHFIGHLQTNKIKYVVPAANLIHSVDSLHLAKAISEFSIKKNCVSPILLEVNTSGESSKFGALPEVSPELFVQISEELKGVSLRGLMTMAPFTKKEKDIRKSFSMLRSINEKLKEYISDPQATEVLSMGMSDDFEIAIEEGSTMIRVGTALFGSRGR